MKRKKTTAKQHQKAGRDYIKALDNLDLARIKNKGYGKAGRDYEKTVKALRALEEG